MPGLLDMFQPQDPLGQQTGFGNALTSRGNAMVGMGMGLMTPVPVGKGTVWSNALQGWEQGAQNDLVAARSQQQAQMERARLALAQSEAGRQASQWQQQFELEKQKFARGNITDAQRAFSDMYPDGATPEQKNEFFRNWYLSKTEGDWALVEGPPDANGNPTKVWANKRTMETRPFGGAAPSGSTTAATPVVPGTTLYWQPGQQGAATPSTTGVGGPPQQQSQLPPEIQSIPNYAARQKAMEEYYKKQATQSLKDPQQEAAAKQSASNVLTALDAAEKLATNPSGFLPTTGIIGGALSNVYQPSKDLALTLDTIKANVSLDKLSAMRAASTTGASGLGAVTEGEHKLLQASISALDQSQSPQQFRANLARVRATYEWIVNRANPNEPPPFSLRPSSSTTSGGGGTGGTNTTRSGVTWSIK